MLRENLDDISSGGAAAMDPAVTQLPPTQTHVLTPHAHEYRNEVVKLSTIDQIAPRLHWPTVLCFALDDSVSTSSVVDSLTAGVRGLLSEEPSLGGILEPVPGSTRHEIQLRTDPTSGAPFTVVNYRDGNIAIPKPLGRFEDLARQHFPYSRLSWDLLVPRDQVESTGDATRVGAVQATFIPGGLLLCIYGHHAISDGTGSNVFIDGIARHVKAASQGLPPPVYKRPDACSQRWRMSIGPKRMKLEDFPEWKHVSSDPASRMPPPLPAALPTTVWYLPHDKQLELREKISAQSPNGVQYSLSESICAFVWHHISKARKLDCGRNQELSSVLHLPVDVRRRVVPPLPADFTGCASQPNAFIRRPLADLFDENKMHEIADEIRLAIDRVDGTAVRRLIGLLNAAPSTQSIVEDCNRWPGPDMLISDLSSSTILTAMDWGSDLGKCKAFRMMADGHAPDGRCIFLPKDPTGGIEVRMTYETDVVQRLKDSPGFAQFAEFRSV